jgi:magnesium chelatase accessory protein
MRSAMKKETKDIPSLGPGGYIWPNPEWSHFPLVEGLQWHVQLVGDELLPPLLLLHGTGSACHSWAGLAKLLQDHYFLIIPDLPGHGRTDNPGDSGLSLEGMSYQLRGLLNHLELEPVEIWGNSAGAAIACKMVIDQLLHNIQRIVAINGALLPPAGMPLHIFSPIAKFLSSLPFVPHIFARHARDTEAVINLISGTGSKLNEEGIALYKALMSNPAHCGSALRMMAQWDLAGLEKELPKLTLPIDLLVGQLDRTIPPAEVFRIQRLIPQATITSLTGLGHLAHEEDPQVCLAAAMKNMPSYKNDPKLQLHNAKNSVSESKLSLVKN